MSDGAVQTEAVTISDNAHACPNHSGDTHKGNPTPYTHEALVPLARAFWRFALACLLDARTGLNNLIT